MTVTPHCQDVCCCDANTKHAAALPYAYLYFGGKAALPPGPAALLPRVCFSVVIAPENKGLVLPLPELGAVRIFKSLPPCHHSLLARLLPAPRAASAPLEGLAPWMLPGLRMEGRDTARQTHAAGASLQHLPRAGLSPCTRNSPSFPCFFLHPNSNYPSKPWSGAITEVQVRLNEYLPVSGTVKKERRITQAHTHTRT